MASIKLIIKYDPISKKIITDTVASGYSGDKADLKKRIVHERIVGRVESISGLANEVRGDASIYSKIVQMAKQEEQSKETKTIQEEVVEPSVVTKTQTQRVKDTMSPPDQGGF
jgi:hypothetical protein